MQYQKSRDRKKLDVSIFRILIKLTLYFVYIEIKNQRRSTTRTFF